MSIVLPTDKIHDLLETRTHGVHPLYGLERLLTGHVNRTLAVIPHLVGSQILLVKLGLAKEQLGHKDLGIVIPWSDMPLERSLFEKDCVRLSLRQEHFGGLFHITALAAVQNDEPGQSSEESDHFVEGHN